MKLLLGIGPDEQSSLALDRTIERARQAGDDLSIAVIGATGGSQDPVVSDVRERLERAGIDAEVHRLEDDAGASLVALAEDREFDRLVLPGGSESPLGKVTFDRTTEYVLMNCCTSVTLVR